jgi:hypothetical protein
MGPGQYSYVDKVILLSGQTTIQTWWGADGSGRIESSGDDPNYSPPPAQVYAPGDFPIDTDLSELSTDPATLADQIAVRSAPDGASPQPDITPGPGQDDQTGELWRAVADILDMPNATPELKAAVFQVAASITGVEVVEEATDPAGRRAVLLQVDTENEHHELYFDPDSLQPLAAVDRSLDETWSISTIVIAAGIVDSTDSTPDPGLVPSPAGEIPEAEGQGGLPVLSPPEAEGQGGLPVVSPAPSPVLSPAPS